jgi:hypothetical protein
VSQNITPISLMTQLISTNALLYNESAFTSLASYAATKSMADILILSSMISCGA